MPAESHQDQVARELMRLGVTSRLKGAPHYHFWEIGEAGRSTHLGLDAAMLAFHRRQMKGDAFNVAEQEAFKHLKAMYADPAVNPYTQAMHEADEHLRAARCMAVRYHYEGTDFVLTDSLETTGLLVDHFHPIRWPEFNEAADWELLREVIPAMQVVHVDLRIFEEQRWLFDERSQRAAETLTYRVRHLYPDQRLPERIATSDQDRDIFEEYVGRLERGTNARRWIQETLARLKAKPRKKRLAEY